MMGIRKLCSQLMGNAVYSLGIVPQSTSPNFSHPPSSVSQPGIHEKKSIAQEVVPDSRAQALIKIFGMDNCGRIKKEKACSVVRNLGLVDEGEEEEEEEEEELGRSFDDELEAKEVLKELGGEEGKGMELLREAFMVFDADGDGFIDAKEIKRVLVCLGLDNGWALGEIEKMIEVVDLNLDGKVDFHEFGLMMG